MLADVCPAWHPAWGELRVDISLHALEQGQAPTLQELDALQIAPLGCGGHVVRVNVTPLVKEVFEAAHLIVS
jgi:hypothetical protein